MAGLRHIPASRLSVPAEAHLPQSLKEARAGANRRYRAKSQRDAQAPIGEQWREPPSTFTRYLPLRLGARHGNPPCR